MNFDITIDRETLTQFEHDIERRFNDARPAVQGAMGETVLQITRMNFGQFGIDRPIEWAPLSTAYAKKVNRSYATLYVTGALYNAVKLQNTDDFSRVYASDDEVPYATIHQFGSNPNVVNRSMPARPYFPITPQGELTEYTRNEVMAAAIQTLHEVMR